MATTKPTPHVAIIVIMIAIVVATIGVVRWSTTKKHEARVAREAKADSVKAAKEIKAKRPMYYVPPQPEQPSLRTWEKIPQEGIKVCLRRGWRTFPIGGGLKIVDPDGGEMHDKLGEKIDFGYRTEGWYMIYPEPLGSDRGVEVLARWCF